MVVVVVNTLLSFLLVFELSLLFDRIEELLFDSCPNVFEELLSKLLFLFKWIAWAKDFLLKSLVRRCCDAIDARLMWSERVCLTPCGEVVFVIHCPRKIRRKGRKIPLNIFVSDEEIDSLKMAIIYQMRDSDSWAKKQLLYPSLKENLPARQGN